MPNMSMPRVPDRDADTDWFFDWPSGYVRYRNGKREVAQDTFMTRQQMERDSHEEKVNHPAHYTSHPSGIEAIELTAFESFCVGNCLKYLLRRKYKGDELGDLLKAKWYLDKEIQRVRDGTCSGSSD